MLWQLWFHFYLHCAQETASSITLTVFNLWEIAKLMIILRSRLQPCLHFYYLLEAHYYRDMEKAKAFVLKQSVPLETIRDTKMTKRD